MSVVKNIIWTVAYQYLPTPLAKPIVAFVLWHDARVIDRATCS